MTRIKNTTARLGRKTAPKRLRAPTLMITVPLRRLRAVGLRLRLRAP